jgi:hypothetical protein
MSWILVDSENVLLFPQTPAYNPVPVSKPTGTHAKVLWYCEISPRRLTDYCCPHNQEPTTGFMSQTAGSATAPEKAVR